MEISNEDILISFFNTLLLPSKKSSKIRKSILKHFIPSSKDIHQFSPFYYKSIISLLNSSPKHSSFLVQLFYHLTYPNNIQEEKEEEEKEKEEGEEEEEIETIKQSISELDQEIPELISLIFHSFRFNLMKSLLRPSSSQFKHLKQFVNRVEKFYQTQDYNRRNQISDNPKNEPPSLIVVPPNILLQLSIAHAVLGDGFKALYLFKALNDLYGGGDASASTHFPPYYFGLLIRSLQESSPKSIQEADLISTNTSSLCNMFLSAMVSSGISVQSNIINSLLKIYAKACYLSKKDPKRCEEILESLSNYLLSFSSRTGNKRNPFIDSPIFIKEEDILPLIVRCYCYAHLPDHV